MAIILPNTRNTMGVPNRYSDLASAGLRWTPPPVYRYDAYDVLNTTPTLYAEGINLADYQYNTDGLTLLVVPDGYKAISEQLAINDAGNLLIKDGFTGTFEVVDYSTTWEMLGGCCYATKTDGTLWEIYPGDAGAVITQVGVATGWTAISGYDYETSYKWAFGICDGRLYSLKGTTATMMGTSSSWTSVTGFASTPGENYSAVAFGINGGNLFALGEVGVHSDPRPFLLDNSGVWSKISGYGEVVPTMYYGEPTYDWSTVYGIRDGNLVALVGQTHNVYSWSYDVVLIDATREWHDVWRVSTAPTSTESTAIAIAKVPIV
jgi:hypothetical protein